jgi:hypothetical protein
MNKTRSRGNFITVRQYFKMEATFQKLPQLEDLLVRDDYEIEDIDELSDAEEEGRRNGSKFKRCNRTEFDSTHSLLAAQDKICVQLQEKELTLAAADDLIDIARDQLLEDVGGEYELIHLNDCYTIENAGLLSHYFEIAVKKLQNKEELDEDDKQYVEILLKELLTVA